MQDFAAIDFETANGQSLPSMIWNIRIMNFIALLQPLADVLTYQAISYTYRLPPVAMK